MMFVCTCSIWHLDEHLSEVLRDDQVSRSRPRNDSSACVCVLVAVCVALCVCVRECVRKVLCVKILCTVSTLYKVCYFCRMILSQ